jgi:hypothetical protein
VKKLRKNAKGRSAELRQCYVYEIRVDGVVRYIGKGCNDRVYSHLIEAKRTASRPGVKVRNLSPHFRKMLVCAVRRGSIITEKIISSKLTDAEAYAMEWQMIWGLPQAARWPALEHDRRTWQESRGFAEQVVKPGLSPIPTATPVQQAA